MPVSDIMRTDVVTASPDASITELAQSTRDHTVGSVVIEEEGIPVGIVTDRDITLRVVAEERDLTNTTAEDVMSKDPVTVEMDAGVYELVETMRDNDVRRMPVVSDGDLTGIVTFDDLVTMFADELNGLASIVRAESPPY